MESRKPEMRNQQPAARKLKRPTALRLIALGLSIFCCLISMRVFPVGTSYAEAGRSMVVGAGRLYVRRGPGTEFPPFATLTKGDTVEVQEMQGEWARIMTGSGLTGYVRSNFLILAGEHRKPPALPVLPPTPTVKPQPVAKPQPTVHAQPVAAAEPTTLRAANARNRSLEIEIRNLQQQLAELKSSKEVTPAVETAVTPSPTPTSTPVTGPVVADADQLHAEIARLTALVESLQRPPEARPLVEGLPAPAPSDHTSQSWLSGALVLGFIGVAIGWLAGSTLGRKPDRGRRSRVRF
jgi:hypothetical protein